MTKAGKVVRRSEALGSAADNRDAVSRIRRLEWMDPLAALHFIVSDEALEIIDAERLLNQGPATLRFAGCRTNPAHDGRQGTSLFDDPNRFLVIAHRDLADISRYIDTGGTGPLAGRGAFVGTGVADHPGGRW